MHQPNNAPERLNKVLAQLGFGSRRHIDTLIAEGKVLVNNQPATLGQRVTEEDTIVLDGKPIKLQTIKPLLVAFHKPRGVTTTKKDRYAKVTVMDYLPPDLQHVNPIGRLDRDSRGLLLFTNNGEIAQKLGHPRYTHEKEYEVEVIPYHRKTIAQFNQDITKPKSQVIHPDYQSKPFTILKSHFDQSKNRGYATIVLTEGKKRQIRMVFRYLGYHVTDLLRTRINKVYLDRLKEGEYSIIDPNQLDL